MPGELLLVNPRPKRRRVTKVRRNPRRQMSALQRQYFGPKRRRARAASRVTVARTNPIRRRRKRSIMRVRRNPISMGRSAGKITSALMPAAIGAGGALALGMVWSRLSPSLPSSLQSGTMQSVAQIAAALGLGLLAGKAFGKSVGTQVAAGALTVTIYNLASSYMGSAGLGTGATANAGGYTYSQNGYTYAGGTSTMNGMGVRKRRRRMNRYVGTQMNGNTPRGLNGMRRYVGTQLNGNTPHGLNGAAVMQPRGGMGYMGPGRVAPWK